MPSASRSRFRFFCTWPAAKTSTTASTSITDFFGARVSLVPCAVANSRRLKQKHSDHARTFRRATLQFARRPRPVQLHGTLGRCLKNRWAKNFSHQVEHAKHAFEDGNQNHVGDRAVAAVPVSSLPAATEPRSTVRPACRWKAPLTSMASEKTPRPEMKENSPPSGPWPRARPASKR